MILKQKLENYGRVIRSVDINSMESINFWEHRYSFT